MHSSIFIVNISCCCKHHPYNPYFQWIHKVIFQDLLIQYISYFLILFWFIGRIQGNNDCNKQCQSYASLIIMLKSTFPFEFFFICIQILIFWLLIFWFSVILFCELKLTTTMAAFKIWIKGSGLYIYTMREKLKCNLILW